MIETLILIFGLLPTDPTNRVETIELNSYNCGINFTDPPRQLIYWSRCPDGARRVAWWRPAYGSDRPTVDWHSGMATEVYRDGFGHVVAVEAADYRETWSWSDPEREDLVQHGHQHRREPRRLR